MAQERLTMRKIREVLRLKWECGLSNRAIARSCSISHSTVAEYLRRTQEAELSWPLPEDLDEDRLFELLFPKSTDSSAGTIPCPDWSWVHAELCKKSVTLRLLWVEYREDHPDGYGYSQFCALYRRWAKRLDPSMRHDHKAGEKVFIDYASQTVPVIDPQTGEIRTGMARLRGQRSVAHIRSAYLTMVKCTVASPPPWQGVPPVDRLVFSLQ